MADNPLLTAWTMPVAVPPFERIEAAPFAPAFERAMAEQRRILEGVATDQTEPTLDNTVVPMERSREALARVESIFFLLAGTDTDDAIMAIEREMAPRLAAH